MCLSGVILFISSEQIIQIFSSDLEVIKHGSSYLKIAAFIGPIYPVFLFPMLYSTALKKTFLIFYSNLLRMVILPFTFVWVILNVMGGYFQDISMVLVMNWTFGNYNVSYCTRFNDKNFQRTEKVFFIF